MTADKETIKASYDGVKFFFVHHMAKTELGQLLSPLTFAPFNHPVHGRFASMLGYSYWLQCGKKSPADELRQVHGTYAIRVGNKVKAEHGIFLSHRTSLREMTYATLLKIQDHYTNNPELKVTIKHEMAGNSLPYIHVRNIRNSDKGDIYGKTSLARVRVLPAYNRLGNIYKQIGEIFKTDAGRALSPEEVLGILNQRGAFDSSDT